MRCRSTLVLERLAEGDGSGVPFTQVRYYLSLAALGAAAAVCQQWRALAEEDTVWLAMIVEDERTGLRLADNITDRRPLHKVEMRLCLRPRDEVRFLHSLVNDRSLSRAPAKAPPKRPRSKDRIGYGMDRMDWASLHGGMSNEWHSVMRGDTLQTAQGRKRLARFFADAPHHWREAGDSCVLCLSSLKGLMNNLLTSPTPAGCQAMLDCGAGTAMIEVLRNQTDEAWLHHDQNYYVSAAMPPAWV